jgi:crotonobetainyl-CoA:carnitine CoA-transferase CaiB-like acyl-CoA transferase
VERLVKWADVLTENFRAGKNLFHEKWLNTGMAFKGIMNKLGFSYEVCSKWNPKLIYATNSGFGDQGEWAERPRFDFINCKQYL